MGCAHGAAAGGPLQNRLQKLQPALLVRTAKIAKINILFIFVLPSNRIVPAKLSPQSLMQTFRSAAVSAAC
jgi:hypothetical protein